MYISTRIWTGEGITAKIGREVLSAVVCKMKQVFSVQLRHLVGSVSEGSLPGVRTKLRECKLQTTFRGTAGAQCAHDCKMW